MGNMTYEQFEFWCKHWNMTIEEGYRAMCFTWNIVNQNFANHFECANKISNENHSDDFKKIVEKSKEDATILKVFYGSLESEVYNMLEKHDKEQTT